MTSLKQRLQRGELVLGTLISEVRNPNVAYLLAQSGFDFFIIDNEHGTYSDETVANMVAAARGADIEVIVRIPEITRATVMKPLDAGATGLLVPQVDTVEEAAEVVRHAKYPPLGKRGVGLRRPHSRYARVDAATYLQQANRDTFIAVQAETRLAIENSEAIAAVEGVDCVFAGPFDLSVDLGFPGQLDHPEEIACIDRMMAACQKHERAGGILLFDAAKLKQWIGKGMRFVVYSSDVTLLADAALTAVKDIKACLG
jgi:2-keto-3-deoxy-L-rhamnonate aldolase RhmA